ncbi:hypothetical protein [Streptomyces sp. NPDC018584]|uniref:hypothetical protein n=1 Tax=unclassified Streptomyces TaxID=2593676 RepID=UPI0037B73E28
MPTPEPTHRNPAATAGQLTDDQRKAAARAFLDDIEDIMQRDIPSLPAEQTPRTPTSYRDPAPVPAIGDALPVQQPGRPAMSQKATDDSIRLLSFGTTFLLVSGGIGVVMVTSDYADPTVLGVGGASVTALLLAAARLMRRTKETVAAAPPQITQNITGPVHQDHSQVTTTTKGFFTARTHIDQSR